MDKISKEKRSEIMSKIRSKNTTPEIIVRKPLFSIGYRYRIHQTNLPGKPDIVFTKKKKVIFINGCFWHGHDCRNNLHPKSNSKYWDNKIETSIQRDNKNIHELNALGWKCLIIWECELNNMDILEKKLIEYLTDPY